MSVCLLVCEQGQARFSLLCNPRTSNHAQVTAGTNQFFFFSMKKGHQSFLFLVTFLFPYIYVHSSSKNRSDQVAPLINLKAVRNLWRTFQTPKMASKLLHDLPKPCLLLHHHFTSSPSNQTFQQYQTLCCFMSPGLYTWVLHASRLHVGKSPSSLKMLHLHKALSV